jgi:hypothetical protein
MRRLIRGMVFLAGACLMIGIVVPCRALDPAKPKTSSSDIAFTFDAARGNLTTGSSFWLEGGCVQFHGQFWRGLGVVADVAGMHIANINSSGVGLDLVTATFGPRYTWTKARSRSSLFGQALAGEAFGLNSSFPGILKATSDSNSSAIRLGAGMNYSLSHRVAVRVLEANWLRTQTPNSTSNAQNNLTLASGIVYRLP